MLSVESVVCNSAQKDKIDKTDKTDKTCKTDKTDKTKKNVENLEKEVSTQRNNLNAIYGALQQTEKLYKLSKGESTNGKKV